MKKSLPEYSPEFLYNKDFYKECNRHNECLLISDLGRTGGVDYVDFNNPIVRDNLDRISSKCFVFFQQSAANTPKYDNIEFHNFYEFYGEYFNYLKKHSDGSVCNNISKHFLFLNKRAEFYRQSLFEFFIDNNLVDKSHLSYVSEDRINGGVYGSKEIYTSITQEPTIELPYYSDDRLTLVGNDNGWTYPSDIVSESFVCVVYETFNNAYDSFFTEKIFKPIFYRRPFILSEGCGALTHLRNMGFKTFGEFWNEDYDIIPDKNEREKRIRHIILKISSLTIDEINTMYDEMLPILKHNYCRLEELSVELDIKKEHIKRYVAAYKTRLL